MAVIEAELTQQGISQHRKQELEIALVTITTNHANGFLTPVAYMQNLENRIGRDRYIMQYLMNCPQPRKVEAQVMMRRVKTMQQELVDMRAQIASGVLLAAMVGCFSRSRSSLYDIAVNRDDSAFKDIAEKKVICSQQVQKTLYRKLKVEVKQMETKLEVMTSTATRRPNAPSIEDVPRPKQRQNTVKSSFDA